MNIKISKFYNKKEAGVYESQRKDYLWDAETETFIKIKKKLYPQMMHQKKSLSILDIPIGSGRWIPHLQDVAKKYIGVDVSSYMLNQAKIKVKSCQKEFERSVQLVKSSIEELPSTSINEKFDLIISTRFLSHFSIAETKGIMIILRKYLKGKLIISVRVAENKRSIFFETFNLFIRSPLRLIKRYFKSGRLSYSKLELDYIKVFQDTGFIITNKNLVVKDKHSSYEYWELK